ncbi:MAG TPA: response regulator transcription factor [Actinomycetota bacterium]|nr:response regulator transcription factor [Actinomycetota bacterium]
MHLLIVDDEPKVVALLRRAMKREGHTLEVATTGDEALKMAGEGSYDAIVLDVMIPPPNGLEVCRRVREKGIWTPILLLTGRNAVEDRVSGLDAGADDYLPKPFSLNELSARLRAITRRVEQTGSDVLQVGELVLDPAAHRVTRGGTSIDLSPKEFALLELFMRRRGEVLSRMTILDHVWDFAYEGGSNVVDVYVRYLRDKVDRPFGEKSIETVRGVGYRLKT